MTDIKSMQSLSKQIGAAHDMMQQILEDPSNKIPGILWGALSGVEIILRQARDAADAQITPETKLEAAS